jgi:hypothetical protein
MIMGDYTPTLPLAGVYAARPIDTSIHVIRSRVQPDWYVQFGEDLPELGWGRFGRHGVQSATTLCSSLTSPLWPRSFGVFSIQSRNDVAFHDLLEEPRAARSP